MFRVKEAADRLGISEDTIYRAIDRGTLPVFRLGKVLRISVADLDAFVKRHTSPANISLPPMEEASDEAR